MTELDLKNKFPWRSYPWLNPQLQEESLYLKVRGKCDPEKLWLLLADTARFNRALGFKPRDEKEVNGNLLVSEKVLGMKQLWVEHPWDWVKGHYIVSHRKYEEGIGIAAKSIVYLERLDDGQVRVHMLFSFIPNGFLNRMLLKVGLKKLKKSMGELVMKLMHQSKNFDPQEKKYPEVYKAEGTYDWPKNSREKLFEYKRLFIERNLDLDLVQKFFDLAEKGDEFELNRIKPIILFKKWGANLDRLLDILIFGTKVGMLQMRWEAICPHCRGPRDEAQSLSRIKSDIICDACQIQFSTKSDNSVEVTFGLSPHLRQTEKVHYCAAEPAKKGHILIQQRIEAQETKKIYIELKERKSYRIRLLETGFVATLIEKKDNKYDRLYFDGKTICSSETYSEDHILCLENRTDEPITLIVEEIWWGGHALPPAYVLLHPSFKNYFPSDVVAENIQLNLGSKVAASVMAIEPNSKTLPEYHKIIEKIRQSKGYILKSEMNSVLCTFIDPYDACEFIEKMNLTASSPVRIAVDHGSIYTVNNKGQLDYVSEPISLTEKICKKFLDARVLFTEPFYNAIRAKAPSGMNSANMKIETFSENNKEVTIYSL